MIAGIHPSFKACGMGQPQGRHRAGLAANPRQARPQPPGSAVGARSRTKGREGEREVAVIFQAAGLAVRGLEGSGDHLIVCASGVTVHSEVKRTERLDLWGALGQTRSEAPQGTLPVLTFRRNRSPWFSVLPTTELAALLARCGS